MAILKNSKDDKFVTILGVFERPRFGYDAVDMARYRFRTEFDYPARFYRVSRRSLENTIASQITLLRIEFEIFVFDHELRLIRSTGKVASRDLLVGLAMDDGLKRYADALCIPKPTRADSWQTVALTGRWVRIRFGGVDETDYRNPFAAIDAMDSPTYRIVEYQGGLLDQWCSVSEAAEDLELSAATLRRRLKTLEPTWGDRLVRRTQGGHRRICLPLLRNLLE